MSTIMDGGFICPSNLVALVETEGLYWLLLRDMVFDEVNFGFDKC